MSTKGRPAEPSAAASAVESADFVRLVARADGDALAASGLLARALDERDAPFQVTVDRTVAARTARLAESTADATIAIGTVDAADAEPIRLETTDRAASLAAVDVVSELGGTPDPILALAGLVAAGGEPGAGESEWLLETARDRDGLERRPGVAVPPADPVDGLAHSTRLLAPWSGDTDATRETLATVADLAPDARDDDARRDIGSAVALDVVGSEGATPAAAESIQRALRPYTTPGAPFETIGGYADVLEATSRTEPGTGVALAMGRAARTPALDAWRTHGRRAHTALEAGTTRRYAGLFVVDVDDGPVEAVARLVAAYRSPEPATLVVGDGEAAVRTRDEATALAGPLEGVARELGADGESSVEYDAVTDRGYLRYEGVDEDEIVAAAREIT